MANMIPISTVTVGSGGASSIEFTGIPTTYTDLVVKVSMRASYDNINWTLKFNSSGSGYSQRVLYGDGSNPASQSLTSQSVIYGYAMEKSTYTSNTFNNVEIYIPNYAGSTNKSVSIDEVSENNATLSYQSIVAGLWSNTAAITSISVGGYTGNLTQYSSATLYGIRKY